MLFFREVLENKTKNYNSLTLKLILFTEDNSFKY